MDSTQLIAFSITGQNITFYLAFNVMFSLCCSIFIFFCFANYRYLWIKPSFWLISYIHVLLQWPFSLYSGYYELWWPNPWSLSILLNASVASSLLVSRLTLLGTAKSLWSNIYSPSYDAKDLKFYLCFLLGLLGLIFALYISEVPFSNTGLYAMIFDSDRAAIAREESLKLIDNVVIKYLYFIGFSAVSPLIAALGTLLLTMSNTGHRYANYALALSAIILASSFNLITGARIGVANILIVIALTLIWRRNLFVSPIIAFCSLLAVVVPAVAVTLLRESSSSAGDIDKIIELTQSVIFRAFGTPIEVGGWFVHFTDTYGPVGVSGIAKLAALMSAPSIDLPNHIAQLYVPVYTDDIVMESTSATAGFIFSAYAVAGLFALPAIPIMVASIDVVLMLISRLTGPLLLATLAATSWSVVMFVQSDYLTVWLTHGFFVVPVIALLLQFLRLSRV